MYTITTSQDGKVYYAFRVIYLNLTSEDIVRNYFGSFPLYSSKYMAYKDCSRVKDYRRGIK